MMTGVPPELQAMMAQFPMTPEMMFGAGMGMMPDPTAFGPQGGFGGAFGQPPPGPSGQNFGGGFGGFPSQQQQQQQQQQGYGQQPYGVQPQQQQLQPPKFPGQRKGTPTRMGSPNTCISTGIDLTV
jgi:hypothetical protein